MKKLVSENSSATNSEVVLVLNRDYQTMKKELDDLRRENKHWQEIVRTGRIVTVETLVSDFIELSRSKLKDIACEAQMTDYSTDTYYAISNLLNYFNDVTNDLGKIMSAKFVNGEFVPEGSEFGMEMNKRVR